MNNISIIKTYKENFPKCRFIGKCYKNSDRVDGMFGFYWEQWHKNDWFTPLEKMITEEFKSIYPEAYSTIGFIKAKTNNDAEYFEYWIGMFLPENCEVPDGYDYIDILNHASLGVCWIKGKMDDVFCHEDDCFKALVEDNMTVQKEKDQSYCMFERYNCPRFTESDENDEIILDIGYFVE